MLCIENVSKAYGALPVVENVSLTVAPHETVTLIGPSGCGKTTLLRMISGLERPDKGTCLCRSEKIAYIFQEDRLLPWKDVWHNIQLVRKDVDQDLIRDLIREVGLEGFAHYLPGQLSGGMKKRCGIARAFYYQADLLLMDEPFQGLDMWLKQELMNMLLAVLEHRPQSIVFVTHNIDEALILADRILLLSPRPTRIEKEIALPPRQGRDPLGPEMGKIRQGIIAHLMNAPTP